jgi:hypothetical protein
LHLIGSRLRLGGRLARSPLLGRQETRRFIAGGLDNVTIETRERLLHQGIPVILIAAVGRLL